MVFQFIFYFESEMALLIVIISDNKQIKFTMKMHIRHEIITIIQQFITITIISVSSKINKQSSKMLQAKTRKVDLKSTIYQDNSHSPYRNSIKKHNTTGNYPQYPNEPKNIKKQYFNTCCPNCRYLFKVQHLKNEASSHAQKNGLSPYNTKNVNQRISNRDEQDRIGRVSSRNSRNIFTQTDSLSLQRNRMSPKVQKTKIRGYTSNTFSKLKQSSSRKIQNIKDVSNQKQKITQKNRSQQIQNTKIDGVRNLGKTNEKWVYPDKGIYMKQPTVQQTHKQGLSPINFQSNKKQSMSFSRTNWVDKLNNPNSKIINNTSGIKQNYYKQFNSIEVNQLLNQIYLSSDLMEILDYQINNLDVEKNVPSYYKMLIYELQDKRSNTKAKIEAKQVL